MDKVKNVWTSKVLANFYVPEGLYTGSKTIHTVYDKSYDNIPSQDGYMIENEFYFFEYGYSDDQRWDQKYNDFPDKHP